MKLPIYLDYAATTPVDERVAELMMSCLTRDGTFGNPASRSHFVGWQAESMVEDARAQLASLLNADQRDIVWTSGATEADNLALKGVASARSGLGRHIITSAIEHKAVLDSCRALEANDFEVTYLAPNHEGVVTVSQVADALRSDTILVSLMHVNNELGSINPIADIGTLLAGHQAYFHVDAAQSCGKLPIDVDDFKIDLLSLSAHKLYGPKGVGALYVRRKPKVYIDAQIHGGGHERGMRSGTLPTHQLVGLGLAAKLANEEMAENYEHVHVLRKQFLDLMEGLDGVSINGSINEGLPHILNLSFEGVDGESLLMSLNDICVSTGSACNSASVDPSFVLSNIGVERTLALAAIRFSFGKYTSMDEVNYTVDKLIKSVIKLRSLRNRNG